MAVKVFLSPATALVTARTWRPPGQILCSIPGPKPPEGLAINLIDTWRLNLAGFPRRNPLLSCWGRETILIYHLRRSGRIDFTFSP